MNLFKFYSIMLGIEEICFFLVLDELVFKLFKGLEISYIMKIKF